MKATVRINTHDTNHTTSLANNTRQYSFDEAIIISIGRKHKETPQGGMMRQIQSNSLGTKETERYHC